MRKRIRGLVKLIEKSTSTIVYSMLDDEIGDDASSRYTSRFKWRKPSTTVP